MSKFTPQTDADSADLASLGYNQKLRRTIGGYTSFALAFSMVSINTGIVTLFADPFDKIGGAAILLWLLVIPMVFAIVLVYSHLAGRIPITGYAYQWSSRLAGPHFGWFTGWTALISFMAGTSATAAAVGSVFAPEIWENPTRGQIQLLSIGATLVVCLLNVFGVRIASLVNNVGASIELAGTVLLGIVLAAGVLFACLVANMAVATRMTFALSRDRMLPGSTPLASVGARTRAPVAAIVFITAVAVLMNLLNEGLVAKIYAMVGLTYYPTYALTLIAAAVAHRKGRIPAAPAGVFDLGRWLWPMVAVGLLWCAVVIAVLTVPEVNNETAVTVTIAIGIGFAWWALSLRRRIADGTAGPPTGPLSAAPTEAGPVQPGPLRTADGAG